MVVLLALVLGLAAAGVVAAVVKGGEAKRATRGSASGATAASSAPIDFLVAWAPRPFSNDQESAGTLGTRFIAVNASGGHTDLGPEPAGDNANAWTSDGSRVALSDLSSSVFIDRFSAGTLRQGVALKVPGSVAFVPDNRTFIAVTGRAGDGDTGGESVARYGDDDGHVITRYAPPTTGAGSIGQYGSPILVNRDGTMFALEGQFGVSVFDLSEGPPKVLTVNGASECTPLSFVDSMTLQAYCQVEGPAADGTDADVSLPAAYYDLSLRGSPPVKRSAVTKVRYGPRFVTSSGTYVSNTTCDAGISKLGPGSGFSDVEVPGHKGEYLQIVAAAADHLFLVTDPCDRSAPPAVGGALLEFDPSARTEKTLFGGSAGGDVIGAIVRGGVGLA